MYVFRIRRVFHRLEICRLTTDPRNLFNEAVCSPRKIGSMKASLVVLFLASLATAQTQTLASSWFYDQDGNTGIVSVIRQGNTTQVYYSFCVETEAASCNQGSGFVPNSAFTGSINTNLKSGNVLTLQVDTSLVPGFSNWVCIQPDYETAGCLGGQSPTVGGLINVTFTKSKAWARLTTSNDKLYNAGSLVQSTSSGTYGFSADMQGTVLGVPANTAGITT